MAHFMPRHKAFDTGVRQSGLYFSLGTGPDDQHNPWCANGCLCARDHLYSPGEESQDATSTLKSSTELPLSGSGSGETICASVHTDRLPVNKKIIEKENRRDGPSCVLPRFATNFCTDEIRNRQNARIEHDRTLEHTPIELLTRRPSMALPPVRSVFCDTCGVPD